MIQLKPNHNLVQLIDMTLWERLRRSTSPLKFIHLELTSEISQEKHSTTLEFLPQIGEIASRSMKLAVRATDGSIPAQAGGLNIPVGGYFSYLCWGTNVEDPRKFDPNEPKQGNLFLERGLCLFGEAQEFYTTDPGITDTPETITYNG